MIKCRLMTSHCPARAMNLQKPRPSSSRSLTTSKTPPCWSFHKRARCDSGAKFAFKVMTTWKPPRNLQISHKIRIPCPAANSQMLLCFRRIRWHPWMRTSNSMVNLQVDGEWRRQWWLKRRTAYKSSHYLQQANLKERRMKATGNRQDQGLAEESQ